MCCAKRYAGGSLVAQRYAHAHLPGACTGAQKKKLQERMDAELAHAAELTNQLQQAVEECDNLRRSGAQPAASSSAGRALARPRADRGRGTPMEEPAADCGLGYLDSLRMSEEKIQQLADERRQQQLAYLQGELASLAGPRRAGSCLCSLPLAQR